MKLRCIVMYCMKYYPIAGNQVLQFYYTVNGKMNRIGHGQPMVLVRSGLGLSWPN
jgi:hypothetical protein